MARADEGFVAIAPPFFAARVERALGLRRDLGLLGERSACRLVKVYQIALSFSTAG